LKKVAIIHDWLVVNAGAEKVLEQMLKVFLNAVWQAAGSY